VPTHYLRAHAAQPSLQSEPQKTAPHSAHAGHHSLAVLSRCVLIATCACVAEYLLQIRMDKDFATYYPDQPTENASIPLFVNMTVPRNESLEVRGCHVPCAALLACDA
jgi:hypothetical protein